VALSQAPSIELKLNNQWIDWYEIRLICIELPCRIFSFIPMRVLIIFFAAPKFYQLHSIGRRLRLDVFVNYYIESHSRLARVNQRLIINPPKASSPDKSVILSAISLEILGKSDILNAFVNFIQKTHTSAKSSVYPIVILYCLTVPLKSSHTFINPEICGNSPIQLHPCSLTATWIGRSS
jgi:hypothetical protein